MAQTWLEQRASRARREGRQEGRQEGMQEALQEALVTIVRKRFPTAAAEYEARIRQEEDAERLQGLIDHALTVVSLDELWPALGA
jgi:CRISPR/Cas system-associated protein Csm6